MTDLAEFAFMPAMVRWVSQPANASSPEASRSQYQRDILQASVSTIERVISEYVSKLVGQAESPAPDLAAPQRLGALQGLTQTLLDDQEGLRDNVATGAGPAGGQRALLAQETLRRFIVEIVDLANKHTAKAGPLPDSPWARTVEPAGDFVASTVARLVLLVVALQMVAEKRTDVPGLTVFLAERAFQTAQTLRGAVASCGLDLVPWKDLPELRTRRLGEGARLLWSSLDEDHRRAVESAWQPRTSIRSP